MNRTLDASVAIIAEMDAVPMILDVVCRTTGMGFAAVARVTQDRWIACSLLDHISFGLKPGGELKVDTTLCDQIRGTAEAIIIEDVEADEAYRDHATPKLYGFRSYVSVPIVRSDGSFFGTLCAIDPAPRLVDTPEIRGMFAAFALLISTHLDDRDRADLATQALAEEKQDGRLREQFIGVLGHDLRNPLQALGCATQLLKKQPLNSRGYSLLALMEGSIARMSGLVDDVMDYTRGRLGGGIVLGMASQPLATVLEQVIAEIRTIAPDRAIVARLALDEPVLCDAPRVGQVLSNLLANAVTHGSAEAPVMVEATSSGGGLEMSVTNTGPPIASALLDKLFEPFYRNEASAVEGLGLGLYIASMIAKAHGGDMEVSSTAAETCFTFRIFPRKD